MVPAPTVPIFVPIFLLLFWQGDDYQRGVAAFQQGRFAEAAPLLERAAAAAPDNAQVWKALGVLHAAQGDTRAAAEPFARACRLNEKLLDACYYHGRALYTLNQFDAALPSLEKALRHDALKSRAETAIAESLEGLGRRDEAERRFQSALARRDPFEPNARAAYARFLLRDGRAAAAIETLTPATPKNAEIHYQLGRAHQQLDHLPDALRHLEQSVQLDPRRPAARLLLARVLRRLNRPAEAETHEAAARQFSSTPNN